MKICTIVGARPQFIKAAPVSRALASQGCQEILVHTGQHYDYTLSAVFFEELQIRQPDYHLEVGSGSHGAQTGQMLIKLEEVLLAEKPDLALVYGDTNSTLAGALAASKLHIPSAHVEAGERSYDRRMPEEVNRLVADSLAEVHLCASQAAVRRLAAEGIRASAHWVGDVMLDAVLHHLPIARRRSDVLRRLKLSPGAYALVTLHRAGNTDDPARLRQIVTALNRAPDPIVFPMHPRTRAALSRLGVSLAPHVHVIEPVGYFDMLVLEENARMIVTDSGGVQREAYYVGIPCLTLRDETEWIETVEVGWNRLVGVAPEKVEENWRKFVPPASRPPIYGDGTASEKVAATLCQEPVAFGAARRNGLMEETAVSAFEVGVDR